MPFSPHPVRGLVREGPDVAFGGLRNIDGLGGDHLRSVVSLMQNVLVAPRMGPLPSTWVLHPSPDFTPYRSENTRVRAYTLETGLYRLALPQGRSANRRKTVTYALREVEACIVIIGVMSTFLVGIIGLKVALHTFWGALTAVFLRVKNESSTLLPYYDRFDSFRNSRQEAGRS